MEITKARKIYMIGVKGVGMTMLAQFLAAKNIEVIGSDVEEKFMTDEVLQASGVKVREGFSADNISSDADLIIFSSAYNQDNNVEMQAAANLKVAKLSYAEALGQIFNDRYGIAVIGSHGKTTTTAWLGYVLEKAGLSPNVLVGAKVPQFNGNTLVGHSDYFVIEADEYQNKLKYYNPKAVLLNNIDYDHPDFFSTPEDYTQAFVEFIGKIPGKGFLVANFDDPIVRSIANVNCRAKVISYAIDEAADYVAYDIKSFDGKEYFKVKIGAEENDDEDASIDSQTLGDFVIQLAGRHNIYNALAVIAAGIELNIDLVKIRKYLEDFSGTARRLEKMGECNGAIILDDYAHHPTEIKATLSAVKKLYLKKNKIVVFHPHTFTRTKALLNDFAGSFGDADELIVIDIYGSAREVQGGVSSQDLVDKIKAQNSALKVQYIPTQKEVEKYLRKNLNSDDVLLLMGAGDVFRVGENLIKD